MIRSLHLADVGALLLFLGKSPVNEARTRGSPSSKKGDLLSAIPLLRGCLLSANKQHSLVYSQQGFVRGLLCLQSCSGPSAWTVEHLLLDPAYKSACFDLLEKIGVAADKVRAERVFLRLDSDSPSLEVAKQAGFSHYLTEHIYRLDHVRAASPEPSLSLRPKYSADEHGLFRLYNAATPMQVRRVVGMTLEEWCQSREREATREMVLESKGEISAHLRLRLGMVSGQFDITTELGTDGQRQLVDYSLRALKGKSPVYCPVPEYQQQLQRILEERGFRLAGSHACLSKQLAVRVREPHLVPLRA